MHTPDMGKTCSFPTFAVTSKVSRWAAQPQLLYAQPFKQVWCLLLPVEHININIIYSILGNYMLYCSIGITE